MKDFELAAERIVKYYLRVSPKERFFIVTDRSSGFPFQLSKACYKFSKDHGAVSKIMKQRRISYGPADRKIVNLFKGMRRNDCLFLCLDCHLGNLYDDIGRSFRTFLRSRGVRFATMVGLRSLRNENAFLNALSLDTDGIRERGRVMKQVLDGGKTLEVSGKSGTNIKCSIEGRKTWLNLGEFFKPGQGGNVPSGYLVMYPVEGSVEGRVVIDIDIKIEADTVPVKEPVEFELDKGEIVGIHGDKALVERIYNDLNNFSLINARRGFDSRAIFRICEIGFGLLPGKPIGLNLLDKSLANVCKVSNGNSWGKGGRNRCRGHRSHLFWLKNVKVDGKLIKLK